MKIVGPNMASTSPDVLQGFCVPASPVSSAVASENAYEKKFANDELIKDEAMLGGEHAVLDVREVQRRLEKIVLPPAGNVSTNLQIGDEFASDLDEKGLHSRFLCQPWSILRSRSEFSKLSCDTGIEECGVKTKEQKKLAVLPHLKFPIYGCFPSRDEYVVVKCKLCGLAVKPVAHRLHMHTRHNMGLKSPEPTTPVASVISPAFPAPSLSVSTPHSSSTVASHDCASGRDDAAFGSASVALDDKGLPKQVRPTPTARVKTPGIRPASASKMVLPTAADNYVVVAPHSADRPLKLTFRRERTNAREVGSLGNRTASNSVLGTQNKDRKKPSMLQSLSSSTGVVARSDSRPLRGGGATPGSLDRMETQHEALSFAVKKMDGVSAAPWMHQVTPSTSTSNFVPTSAVGNSKLLATPVTQLSSDTPPSIISSFQTHVYEHPRPLASSRFAQQSPLQIQLPSAVKLDYGDHACYLMSSCTYNQRRWSSCRRYTQSIRDACRRLFVSDEDNGEMAGCSKGAPVLVIANGSMERPRKVDYASSRTLNNTSSYNRRTVGINRKPQFTILRQPGANNRMVRVAGSGDTGNGHVSNPVPSDGKLAPPAKLSSLSSTSMANKTYTKVNINQLKAAAVESGSPQLALDLGSLMLNGSSSSPHADFDTMITPMDEQKRMATKRPSFNASPYSASALASEAMMGKRPRLHPVLRANGTSGIVEIEDPNMNGLIHPKAEKAIASTSLNHVQARQQLVRSVQQSHVSNNNRRKPAYHQLTPIVVSPSQTPQPSSLSQNQQPGQQQVVLVSVNGPAVLTGWQKLNSTTTAGDQFYQQSPSFVQNGMATGTPVPFGTVGASGARIIRPKIATTPAAVPVFVAHSDQILQRHHYRHSSSFATHRLSSNVRISRATGGIRALKQPQSAKFYRRPNSTVISTVNDMALYPSVQQQPYAQFRSMQTPHQLSSGALRCTSASTTPVIAGPIVLNVATIAKGTPLATNPAAVGSASNQHVSRQSAISMPVLSASPNVSLNFMAATNATYAATPTTIAAVPDIFST